MAVENGASGAIDGADGAPPHRVLVDVLDEDRMTMATAKRSTMACMSTGSVIGYHLHRRARLVVSTSVGTPAISIGRRSLQCWFATVDPTQTQPSFRSRHVPAC
jgi:hypothetical protein